MEYYNYIKALHLIFVITWFAGLFYIPRLFIYHIEATHKPEPQSKILIAQFKVMAKRLWYIITWPSAILACFFAVWLLYLMPDLLEQPWMQVKLGFVLLLLIYHLKCHNIFKQLQADVVQYTSRFMRIWNEVATLILFSVVFLAILKNAINWIFGLLGLVLLSILLAIGIKLYRRLRERESKG